MFVDYSEAMIKHRSFCKINSLVPLYYYTTQEDGKQALEKGLSMSTQNQGESGVYFSLHGPTFFQVDVVINPTVFDLMLKLLLC